MSYNGWTNWATWNAILWVDNEYAIYQARMEAKPATASAAEEFYLTFFPDGATPDMDSLSEFKSINFGEIAEHWAEDYES